MKSYMNLPAKKNEQYKPTYMEHLANIATHGVWIIPSIFVTIYLANISNTYNEAIAALVFGTGLLALLVVSTSFHFVSYQNNNACLRHVLHRGDRAMIYIFIATSYFPWFSLHPELFDVNGIQTNWLVWMLASFGIIYQQIFYEKYKLLDTLIYIIVATLPSVLLHKRELFPGIHELLYGGIFYIAGTVFFKMDGRIPFAHAIWHSFVIIGSAFHSLAIAYFLIWEKKSLVTT